MSNFWITRKNINLVRTMITAMRSMDNSPAEEKAFWKARKNLMVRLSEGGPIVVEDHLYQPVQEGQKFITDLKNVPKPKEVYIEARKRWKEAQEEN